MFRVQTDSRFQAHWICCNANLPAREDQWTDRLKLPWQTLPVPINRGKFDPIERPLTDRAESRPKGRLAVRIEPDGFAAVEAHRFAVFLQARSELMSSVPYLSEVLAFEKALVDATLFGEPAELHWSIDPTLLLGELEAGRLPTGLPPSPSRMSVAT
jgi:hypothetical protein